MISVQFTLHQEKFVRLLVFITIGLAIAGMSFTALSWHLGVNNSYFSVQVSELFSLNHEGNVPTLFSAGLWLMASTIALVIAKYKSETKDRWHVYWHMQGLLFLYLAIDEASVIHEIFTAPLREIYQLGGFLYFSWLLVGIPFVLIVGALLMPFLMHLDTALKQAIFVGASIYLAGAIGLDAISAAIWDANGGTSLLYSFVGTIEEVFEMAGIIIVINGLLSYIRQGGEQITIALNTESQQTS